MKAVKLMLDNVLKVKMDICVVLEVPGKGQNLPTTQEARASI